MPIRGWVYISSVLLLALVLIGWALTEQVAIEEQRTAFGAFVVLAILGQLFKGVAPNRQSYYISQPFFFASVLLLHPLLFVGVVAIPHLIEWAVERVRNSPYLRNWYLQPFNIAAYIIPGFAAQSVYRALDPGAIPVFSVWSVVCVTAAALTYVILNHLLIGAALQLGRGISLGASGVLGPESLGTDFILIYLGYAVAALWMMNPWLILPALSPLVLIYQALKVPSLTKEAQTDTKTGLWNARHFKTLFTAELQKAERSNRPLALIMADLDLLRNVNNTYGHLAGDTVLRAVSNVIKANLRNQDIAGRFGGEEFAVLLPDAELTQAVAIANRLRAAIEEEPIEIFTSPTPIHVTMSLGIARYPQDATTQDDLIHEADVAVYQAKLQGRNRVITACDVPHSVRMATFPGAGDRSATEYAAADAPRPNRPATGDEASPSSTTLHPTDSQPGSHALPQRKPPLALWLYIAGVIATAGAVTLVGSRVEPYVPLFIIVVLTALAILAEALQVNLFDESTISTSAALNVAAALVTGIPGVAVVSAGIALVHAYQKRPRPYKVAFNWATYVLTQLPFLALHLYSPPLSPSTLAFLLLPAAAASLAAYAINTGLVAGAISLASRKSIVAVWREQFQWLAAHYAVLGLIGLVLAVAYAALGGLVMVILVLPLFMMRFVQQQYVDRTEMSVRELRRMNKELRLANEEIMGASQIIQQRTDELFLALAQIVDTRDPHVGGHAVKVAEYAEAIAIEMQLPSERVQLVQRAGLLHDIGKIGIPESILHKPGTLTPEEYEQVVTHATIGASLLETSESLRSVAPFVRHHHEFWNGKGYPTGLAGEAIPLEARILALSDAVEAMASARPYHRPMPLEEVIAEVKRCAGTQFDPTVVSAFVAVVERRGATLVVNSARQVEDKPMASTSHAVQNTRKPANYFPA